MSCCITMATIPLLAIEGNIHVFHRMYYLLKWIKLHKTWRKNPFSQDYKHCMYGKDDTEPNEELAKFEIGIEGVIWWR